MRLYKQIKMRSIRSMLRAFRKDERGVSAVEFAFVLPIMFALLLASWETTRAMMVKKKADSAAMTLSDLVTQGTSIDQGSFNGIQKAVESIMYPYENMNTRLRVIGISVDNKKKITVKWDFSTGADLDANSLPADLLIANSFYVMSAAEVDYAPVFGSEVIGAMTFRDTSIMVPRISAEIKTSN